MPAATADAKVAVVAIEHLTQAFALQFKRPMPHEPALLIERLEPLSDRARRSFAENCFTTVYPLRDVRERSSNPVIQLKGPIVSSRLAMPAS